MVRARDWFSLFVVSAACGGGEASDGGDSSGTSVGMSTSGGPGTNPTTTDDATATSPTTSATDPTVADSSGSGGSSDDESSSSTGGDDGPMVDVSDPQLYAFMFTAADADPEATEALGVQLAYLDTRVPPRGELAVYLHGAGEPGTCGGTTMGEVLAGMGFHVIMPCYRSEYGVGNCGDDIAGCRLEAFEGVDHHALIDVTPSNSIERRVVRGLEYLQQMHPGGDWQWFVEADLPRWDAAVISGISHGASSSGVIGQVRAVERVVMLSGPLDSGQAWLLDVGVTPIDRYFGFTHTGDDQHAGHLQSFEDLGLPGAPTVVDGMAPPYGGSHRLVSSAPTDNGHGSTQAGSSSPEMDGQWVFMPVWETMYVGE